MFRYCLWVALLIMQGWLVLAVETTDDLCPYDASSDEFVLSDSTMAACQDFCQLQNKQLPASNDTMYNGLCVLGTCYCTEVGIGTCQDSNHEGCDAVCFGLSEDWVGVCVNDHCHCFN
ncbi:hypothetical protein DM01DRAFT_1340245 [Hesseltinella vesiculosa]|uniref:Invertebrate defensins family profile domain-containing protein n=1 Tax=Hesseltinella vesiculosa TaxID=101127 RepID=A0A1X2G4P1_9FUNG|nr:hypothetical protein DM01DRAFT_1340245 [Hesseltinella vesiculosa]